MGLTKLYKFIDADGGLKMLFNCNPDIKIYQMTIYPDAFRLKEELN